MSDLLARMKHWLQYPRLSSGEKLMREVVQEMEQLNRDKDEAMEAARFCWTCGCKDMWIVYRQEAVKKWPWLEDDDD